MNLLLTTGEDFLRRDNVTSSAVPGLRLCFLMFAILAFAGSAFSADWYVRPSSTGAATGTDWNNAWSIPNLNVNWGRVSAGDTIWMAGGTYTSGINFTKSGSAGNPITLKRVRSSDSVPTTAPGWNSSFDSQVVITPSNDPCFEWSTNAGSYVTIDGRFPYGIRAGFDNSANAFIGGAVFHSSADVTDILIQYCDLHGPAGSTSGDFNFQGDNAVVNVRSGEVNNLTISRCDLHGAANIFYNLSNNLTNFTVEYCDIRDNRSSNSGIHANIFYNTSTAHDLVFRYNKIHNWQVEGFCLWAGAASAAWYFYGNVFYDPATSVATCFWPGSNTANQAQGPIYLYNNTFVDCAITSGQSRSWQFKSGSLARNNIYWNSSFASNSTISDSDYNFSNGNAAGANSIDSGVNPFVNLQANDFRITSVIAVSSPRNKGSNLGSQYSRDMNGNTRGSDGAWDIGAYEYAGGGGSTPTPTPSPTATPTPSPSATPTPSPTATPMPPPQGLSFPASGGTITGIFDLQSDGDLLQTIETPLSSGGRATYLLTVPNAGDYTISAVVDAPNTAADSFFVNIDAEPTDPLTIWDIRPPTSGFESRTVGWRGNGTFDSPQFPVKVFNLSAGVHQLIIRGREGNAQLRTITIVPAAAAPAAPTGLRVIGP